MVRTNASRPNQPFSRKAPNKDNTGIRGELNCTFGRRASGDRKHKQLSTSLVPANQRNPHGRLPPPPPPHDTKSMAQGVL